MKIKKIEVFDDKKAYQGLTSQIQALPSSTKSYFNNTV